MSKRKTEGPSGIPDIWFRVADGISQSFWTYKGLSGNCPFCGAESDSSKMKFLVHFTGSSFKGFNCFVCGQSGSGFSGAQKLFRSVGVSVPTLQMDSVISGSHSEIQVEEKEGDVGVIEWPPAWTEESDEIFVEGFKYLQDRGILDPEGRIERHELRFSESVLVELSSGPYLKRYPCVIAPMHNIDGDVIGFISRRIGEPLDGEAKSSDQSGAAWKKEAVFGLSAINPRKPVTIVEGLFSALSTPNAVACGGKKIHPAQIRAIAATGARVFVFALDPEVDKKFFGDAMYQLSMEVPEAIVTTVDWAGAPGELSRDPNDRGEREMASIIKQAVLNALDK